MQTFIIKRNEQTVDKTPIDEPKIPVYDSIEMAQLDIDNIEEGQIIGTKDSVDTGAIEEGIKADLDKYAENLMQSYGQVIGSYLATENNNDTPQGYLLADGRDTTGTEDELLRKYPLLYAYLGNTNVLPCVFDHSKLSGYEDITLSTDSSNPTTMDYDGYLSLRCEGVFASSTPVEFDVYVNGIMVASSSNNVGNAHVYSPGLFLAVNKGDLVYVNHSLVVSKACFYKSHKYIKAVSGIETGSTEATEVANAVNTIKAYVSNAEVYSTTEVKTNKTWIDGKPIYRKVVTAENQSDRTNITFPQTIDNLDTVVSANGFFKSTSGSAAGYQIMIPMSGDQLRINTATGVVELINRSTTAYADIIHVVVEYTKA